MGPPTENRYRKIIGAGRSAGRIQAAPAVGLLVALLPGAATIGQDSADENTAKAEQSPEPTAITVNAQPLSLVRTEVPPTIDGVLDEPLWEDAALIENLTQVDPVEGGEPTQRTEVRITYDSDMIYFGIRCFDTEPDKIIAKQLRRDATQSSDDRVQIVIDPFFTRRYGFLFEINPLGARLDALIERGRNLITDWDGIWYGDATIDEQGWAAEVAIPYKTISFDKNATQWGFNIERTIRRTTERDRWASPSQNVGVTSMATAGVIDNIHDIDKGIGLDFVPYGKGTIRDDDERGTGNEFDAGFDLFYKLTPSMNLALTVNTDFAETEVDERQVNLTRFPLFFPEKRDFFLQDAGIFNFGGIRRNPLPYQSRRIGLNEAGRPVDIIAGAKLTGRAGPLNLGVLSVYQDSARDVDEQLLSVGRVSLNVLDESSVGVIATVGNPTGNDDNYIAGADFSFRDSTVFGDKVVTSDLFFLHSSSPDSVGDDQSWGARVGYPNDRVSWFAGVTQIGDDYNAELGFVPRRGIREYFSRYRYRWRQQGGNLRWIEATFNPMIITDPSNNIETEEYEFRPLEVQTNEGDRLGIQIEHHREVLSEPFEIQPGVVIPVDDYRFNRVRAWVTTSDSREFSGVSWIEMGDFFDGTRLDTAYAVQWRPSPHFFTELAWEQSDVDLPQGDFEVQIARARVNFMFTPNLSWTNFIQWDNISDTLGINSRVRWIVEPGSEVFFVVNQGFDTHGGRFDSVATEVTTKVGWTFRY